MATSTIFDSTTQHCEERYSMRSIIRKLSKKESSLESVQNAYSYSNSNMATRRSGSSYGNPFKDPPPAYTPAPEPTTAVFPITRTVQHLQQVESDDAYSFLKSFDTVILIDDSGSMAGSRWSEAADAIATITPICTSHDADGIDIYFLNAPDSPANHGVQRASTVHEIFTSVRPGGGTPTGQRLRSILAPYLRMYEHKPDSTKPINIICVTDGDAHDDVESPLIEAAKKLDALDAPAWQVGVQFFQIGNDPAATELLQYLDDELANGSMRDIVDTVPYRGRDGGTLTADGVLKVVLGSVNRRLDRRRSTDLHRSLFSLADYD